ncbi:MAG: c-type cytochrome [Betaproteobacteria bacterium]|nr:c-type cytochrome [Betaproteobacteria bacterium]
MKNTLMFALLATLFTSPFSHAEDANGDPAKAQQLVANVCSACHGADGNSTQPDKPTLAGQGKEYIIKQLTDFKSGKRVNAIMNGMTASLTPDDIKNLAAYFSEQIPKPGIAKDPVLAAAGEKIYKGGDAGSGVPACAACHGPTGAGIPAQFPRLAGQHSEYVYAQLNNFRLLQRTNDGGKMMETISQRLTDQQMKAVAEYVSGLQ